jgi:hypothetical protein
LASVRGRRRGSTEIKIDKVLLDVVAGASDELLLAIRKSFQDGRCSPLTSMDEREWQIMLEQFIASGVVVKNKVINIDSDRILLVVVLWCLHHFRYSFVLCTSWCRLCSIGG